MKLGSRFKKLTHRIAGRSGLAACILMQRIRPPIHILRKDARMCATCVAMQRVRPPIHW